MINSFEAPHFWCGFQHFHGMLGYHQWFILGYFTLLALLMNQLKKDRRWDWSYEYERVFYTVREMLCSCPILQVPDFTKPFALVVVASRVAANAVIASGW